MQKRGNNAKMKKWNANISVNRALLPQLWVEKWSVYESDFSSFWTENTIEELKIKLSKTKALSWGQHFELIFGRNRRKIKGFPLAMWELRACQRQHTATTPKFDKNLQRAVYELESLKVVMTALDRYSKEERYTYWSISRLLEEVLNG